MDSRLRGNDQPPSPEPRIPNSELRLMQRIMTQWGELIQEACKYSSVPPEFLAALIANESGKWIMEGKPVPPRFEPIVYKHLKNVQTGVEEHYGAIRRDHLLHVDDTGLRKFASSWGLAQVMGYHVARRPGGIEILLDPRTHLNFALGLLAQFAEHYGLRVTVEFEEMFRCWNSGAPRDDPKTPRIEGQTYDPKYVERGLARMEIYKQVSGTGQGRV